MRVGMLWFDNSAQRDLDDKLNRAIQYYEAKYGIRPTLCFVHPSMLLSGNKYSFDGVEVRISNMVLPHHFWLGKDGETKQRPAA